MTNGVQQFWVHNLTPIALQIGPLAIRWYGMMYIAGFAAGYWLLQRRMKAGLLNLPNAQALQDMLFYAFCGVLIGGRLGHCVFYEPMYFIGRPWEILMVWTGGMSSHGGFFGVMVAMVVFARRRHVPFLHLMDNIAYGATPGLFFGRLGNFINGELWGRVTTVSWAVVFPQIDRQPRHPVQLYQAFTEGLLVCLVLVLAGRKRRPDGVLIGLFGIVYGAVRIVTENYREKSEALAGPLGVGLTQGQFLSIFVIAIGALLMVYGMRHRPERA